MQKKWNYILSESLVRLIFNLPLFSKKNGDAERKCQKLQKFVGIGERFPTWGSYLQIHLLNLKEKNPEVSEPLKQQQQCLLNLATEQQKTETPQSIGESLLAVIIKIEDCLMSSKSESYSQQRKNEDLLSCIDQFTKSIIWRDFTTEQGKIPSLYSSAWVSSNIHKNKAGGPNYLLNIEEQTKLLDQILKGFKTNQPIPSSVLEGGIFILLQQNNLKKADELLTLLMNNCQQEGIPPSIGLLKMAAFIKATVEDSKTADRYLTQILQKKTDKNHHLILIHAIIIKVKLQQWEEADALCTQFLKRNTVTMPPLEFLKCIVLIKQHLNMKNLEDDRLSGPYFIHNSP